MKTNNNEKKKNIQPSIFLRASDILSSDFVGTVTNIITQNSPPNFAMRPDSMLPPFLVTVPDSCAIIPGWSVPNALTTIGTFVSVN